MMETCPHGLTTHCALCMHEGKGARPSALKVATDATEMVLRGASKQLDLLAEIEILRQQLAESKRQRVAMKGACTQASFCIRELIGEHPDAVYTVGLINKALETQSADEFVRMRDHEAVLTQAMDTEAKNAALTAQLAQYQQTEPVAFVDRNASRDGKTGPVFWICGYPPDGSKLYTTPQPAAVAMVLPEEKPEAMICPECWADTLAEVRRLTAEVITVQELARLKTLARRTVWLAYAWNDHNFAAAHIMARETCASVGIRNLEDAENFATAIQASQSQETDNGRA